jgi:acyl-CoA synthetase (AMP-forming)/AMP-acid ligase II
MRSWPRHDAAAAARFRAAGHWRGDTLPQRIDHWAEAAPGRLAATGPEGPITCSELSARSRAVAAGFRRRGWRRGDVVGLQLPNGVDFLLAFVALARLGAVAATIHMPYRAREIGEMLGFARARAVIGAGAAPAYDAPAALMAARAAAPTLEHVVVAGPAPPGTLALAEIEAEGARLPPAPDEARGDDPLVLCFTSGTAASPKAVIHTHEAMLGSNRAAAGVFGLGEGEAVLSAAPYTHVFGLGVACMTLNAGGTLPLLPAFTPEALVETAAGTRPSLMFAAPAHTAAVLQSGLARAEALASLRAAYLGGALLTPAALAAWEDAMPNGRSAVLFGMTEIQMGLAPQPTAPRRVRHERIGPPIPGLEARVVDDEGHPRPDRAEGELEFRGASLAAGYLDNPEANAAAYRADGWFRTGDLAWRDGAGNFTVTGRLKDLVNRGGIKINPADIESVLAGHPAILEAAIVPVPDRVLGERMCLCVTLRPGAALTLPDVTAFLAAAGIAKLRWPERLEILDALPLTPTRKVMKRELARRFGG